MVDAVGRHPEDRTALEGQRAAPGQEILDPLIGLVAAVGQQAVIRHADAEHAGDAVQDERGEHRAAIDEEQRRDRPAWKARHRHRRDGVPALLIFRPYLSVVAAIGVSLGEGGRDCPPAAWSGL